VTRRTGPGLPARVVGIGTAIALMVMAIAWLGSSLVPVDGAMATDMEAILSPPGAPIAAEADVFRTRPGDLAADPGVDRRAEAHERTLAMHRRLRAFPGAPPRIPHGLTPEEFRGGHCNTCHERGGYVERFASYAPVTPHPEMGQCLQCHVPDYDLVGLPLPDGRPDAVCYQCHILDAERPLFDDLDWPEPTWPQAGRAALLGAPPAVPHSFQLRENCLACHMGAGAVEEIRTTHPERANCRQCHVPAASDTDVFVRSSAAITAAPTGGDS
jgi:nitrate reductase (cytochrome), electron transfer subunit